jgi:glycosyltransferase involved in cell wall biosynthesis
MRKPILSIFYQFDPLHPTIGGIQTVILNFIKYAPEEFELKLIGTSTCPDQPIGQWQEAELAGKRYQFFPVLQLENDNIRGKIPTTLKYTWALLGRNLATDFMHFHRLEPAIAALPWSGDKTFFIHNDIRQQMEGIGDKQAILWRRFPAAYFALEQILVNQFAQILSCNSRSIELYQQRYPKLADRMLQIKNSVDNDIFYPWTDAEIHLHRVQFARHLGLADETRFVLFAGRLHPQKDPLLLVRAIATLDDPQIHLLIAGDGELVNEIKAEIVRLNLDRQVTLLGPVNQQQLAELHRICNALVLTSVYEGLPMVVLEALASGTPIVTTRCGETPQLLSENTGVVCEQRSPSAIAEALRRVLQYPESFPSWACAQAAEPYSARSVVQDIYAQMWQRWESRNGCSARAIGSKLPTDFPKQRQTEVVR